MKTLSFHLQTGLLVLLTALPTLGFSGQDSQLSLDDCVALGLQHTPEIQVARSQLAESQGRLIQAKSANFPQLAASSDFGRLHVEASPESLEDDNLHGRLSASQLIYDFGKTGGSIRAGQQSFEAAGNNLFQVAADTVFSVKAAFYKVVEKHYLITVANDQVKNYQMHLDRAQAYFKAGVRTKIDVTNARVELSNSKLALLKSRFALKLARTELEKSIGIKPLNGNYQIEVEQQGLEEFALLIPPLPPSLADLLTRAMENRPNLAQVKKLIEAAEANITSSRADYWPTIGANASYDAYESDIPSLQDQWQIGVALNWQLFSGLRTAGQVAEASATLRKIRAQSRALELIVTQEVTESYLLADENRSSVLLSQEILELALENLDLADQRYRAGLGDMIEFNDAQTRLTEAKSQLVTTFYAYETALAAMDRAIGKIPDIKLEE